MIGKVIFSVKGIFVQNGCLRKKAVQNVICIPNKTQIRHEKWEKV